MAVEGQESGGVTVNGTIVGSVVDLLKLNKKNYNEILKNAVKLEELLTLSNKGREPIYIEALLNQLLI